MNSRIAQFTFASLALFATSAFAQSSVVQGDVTGVDGRAAKGAEVRLQPARAQLPPIVVKADARGRFVANNVPAGAYNILAVGPGGVRSPVQAIKVQANKPLIVAFDLRNTAGAKVTAKGKKKTKFVWVPDETGSHLGGHYVEVDDDADTATVERSEQHVDKANGNALRRIQSNGALRSGTP